MPKNFRTASWTAGERRVLHRLNSPERVQDFLDELRYSNDDNYHCPRRVMRDRAADCGDGALFAAAALRELGHRPRVVHLAAVRDDDHMITVFQHKSLWGAVSKSNTAGLRFREPIHRTLRELVLTYFEWYYNLKGEKTLRAYSRPLDLTPFDKLHWTTDDTHLTIMLQRVDAIPHYHLLPPHGRSLRPVDSRCFKAGLVGARTGSLYGNREGTQQDTPSGVPQTARSARGKGKNHRGQREHKG